jgi:hypothetical protein
MELEEDLHLSHCELGSAVENRIRASYKSFAVFWTWWIIFQWVELDCITNKKKFLRIWLLNPVVFIVYETKIPLKNTCKNIKIVNVFRPPLWSSGQSSCLQIQRSRVRFPALPDFLRGSVSGTGIIKELLEWKSSGSGSRKSRLTVMGIRCADHATPSIHKSGH